ncbi:MAG: DUF423 domain-containing protein [Alphaproteobacteria bacterium]|nr:DUF423 domain-containing protein [Alphaproteobacteria bacterium]
MPRFWLIAGALNMLLALIVAAAAGHRLDGEFVPIIRDIFGTAREMHFVHALALIAVGLASARFGPSRLLNFAGYAFLAGILFFCGGLYLGHGPLPAVRPMIPFGGASFMLGWILFAAAMLNPRR